MAGGTLELVHWEVMQPPPTPPGAKPDPNAKPWARLLRVWLPPGFYPGDKTPQGLGYVPANASPPGGWPVIYLNDGQNLFDPPMSLSGHSWKAADTAAALIRSGALPPFVIVGIDHAGAARSLEYTPCKPGVGPPPGPRQDAAGWPGGGVDAYLARVVNIVMPWAQGVYEVASHPARVAFGGSSFGGIATLCLAMRYPGLVGSALVESPSLWIGEERFLRGEVLAHSGPWPARVFLAMGDSEYRGDGNAAFSRTLVDYVTLVARAMEAQGLVRGQRLSTAIGRGAMHNEEAWAKRLPAALTFLCSHWRQPLQAGGDEL